MNRLGCALPLQHHTMSGDVPLFHLVASAITRTHPSDVLTSAAMWWNRCTDGEDALFCVHVSGRLMVQAAQGRRTQTASELFRRFPSSRPTRITLAPFLASSQATLRPSPRVLPVMTTVYTFRERCSDT
jgi:hypothetical protein